MLKDHGQWVWVWSHPYCIQISLSQTHEQLESLSTPPHSNDDFLNQPLSAMKKMEKEKI